MPLYDFMCSDCGSVVEKRVHVDDRNNEFDCELCHGGMKRLIQWPLCVLWQGKFHDPWAQKQDWDGLGSEW